ncbi:hypothetical protein [Aquipuribacter sp. MA13-6]|uniref:hypothetical protein n=1 Tax=Aquipuribacter sp. MA13-6 TaxID=3440839 RepID=UPI003F4958A5
MTVVVDFTQSGGGSDQQIGCAPAGTDFSSYRAVLAAAGFDVVGGDFPTRIDGFPVTPDPTYSEYWSFFESGPAATSWTMDRSPGVSPGNVLGLSYDVDVPAWNDPAYPSFVFDPPRITPAAAVAFDGEPAPDPTPDPAPETPAPAPSANSLTLTPDAFGSWATGYEDYEVGAGVDATWRTPDNAVGPYGTDLVVLGDSGSITLTFDQGIENAAGEDFGVFENGFGTAASAFLEFAEVTAIAADGTEYDFPSLTTRTTPVGPYETVAQADYRGLAGIALGGFATGFDLTSAGVPAGGSVTAIRLDDVLGDGSVLDSAGNPVYDPTPGVGSAGFDLRAVGVLNPGTGVPSPGDGDEQTGDVEVRVGITQQASGGLALSLSGNVADLGVATLSPDLTALVAEGEFPVATVADTRTINPGWTLTASSTDFTGFTTIPGAVLGITPEVVSADESVSVTPGPAVPAGTGFTAGTTLATAPAGRGTGTARVGADLLFEAPTATPPGAYVSTVTVTVF